MRRETLLLGVLSALACVGLALLALGGATAAAPVATTGAVLVGVVLLALMLLMVRAG